MEAGLEDRPSRFAAEGTAAHQVLTWALQQQKDAADFVGSSITADGFDFVVDPEMASYVQVTVDYVRDIAGQTGVLLVDTRVNYAEFLGVPEADAWGTADVIVILPEEIVVIDFKYGRGVRVDSQANPQMSLYGLGALGYYAPFAEFQRARLVISQPRVSAGASEYACSIDELMAWTRNEAIPAMRDVEIARRAADLVPYLQPSDKACRFCKAKSLCPAIRTEVALATHGMDPATAEEFDQAPTLPISERVDADWLSASLRKVDLIEDWCKAIRTEVEARLLQGRAVPGFKLVPGKKGNRQWSDPAVVEEVLRKRFRLTVEQAYDLKLISPTSAEKLKKAGVIGDRQWPVLQDLITQKEGTPHVAPESDPRPALDVSPPEFV